MSRRKYSDVVGMCYVGNTNECLLCGYTIASKTGIRLHMKIKHQMNKCLSNAYPTCFACGKDFENYGALLNHLKKKHY